MIDVEATKRRITGDIRKLNSRLLEVSKRLEQELAKHEVSSSPFGLIVHAFFRKAVRTFQAIELLKKEHLYEESWVLLRVLLETHVNLLYFLRHDFADMTRRWNDAAILEKLKHLREVGFYEGTPLESLIRRKDFESAENEIRKRYSKDAFEALRKHGFSGLPFDQRSKEVGLKSMYEYCYRIASRSIHTFDPAETGIVGKYTDKGYREELLKRRRLSLESVGNMLLGRITYIVAVMVESPLGLPITLLGLGYEKFRDLKKEVLEVRIESESPIKSVEKGDIYIWRE